MCTRVAADVCRSYVGNDLTSVPYNAFEGEGFRFLQTLYAAVRDVVCCI